MKDRTKSEDEGAAGSGEGAGGEEEGGKEKRILTMDIDLRFRDLKAAVPIWSGDLSVANNALIRPIVAFIK